MTKVLTIVEEPKSPLQIKLEQRDNERAMKAWKAYVKKTKVSKKTA